MHVLVSVRQIVIRRFGNHVKIQPFGALGLVEHELAQTFWRGVTQPFLHRQAIALGLGDFLPLLIQKQFVCQTRRRRAAQNFADTARQAHAVDQILARHFVIHTKCIPAHGPVGLPLHFGMATRYWCFKHLTRGGVCPAYGACDRVNGVHLNLHDLPRVGVQRQNGGIGCSAVRPQCGQDHGQNLVMHFQHAQQSRIKPAGRIILGGRCKLVFKPETVEERAQPRVVMGRKRVVRAKRVRHAGERLANIFLQHLTLGHVIGHLAQGVHIVRKSQQTGRTARKGGIGLPHPGCAGDLTKGADMGQARGTIPSFQQGRALIGACAATRCNVIGQFACLFKRPRARKIGSGCCLAV